MNLRGWLGRLLPSSAPHAASRVELSLPIPERYRDLWAYAQKRLVRQDAAGVQEAIGALQRIVDEQEFDTLPPLFQVATLANLGAAYARLHSASGDSGHYGRATGNLDEAWRRLWNRDGDDARMILDTLAIAAADRFERTLLDSALEEMIERHEALLRLGSLERNTRHERRHTLMSGLQERIRRGHGPGDGRRLLELLDEALADRTPTRDVRARYASLKAELTAGSRTPT
ncbi:MAG TPA: hypothetical protein VGF28_08505 [Thermoanaerobaculia bacterium]|jgi:hypothetical protein